MAALIVLSVVVRWPLLSPLVILVSHSEKPSCQARVWFARACREAPVCSRASLCVCLHLPPPPFPSCSALSPGLHFHPLWLVIPDQGTPSGSRASRALQQTSGTGLIPHICLHLSLIFLETANSTRWHRSAARLVCAWPWPRPRWCVTNNTRDALRCNCGARSWAGLLNCPEVTCHPQRCAASLCLLLSWDLRVCGDPCTPSPPSMSRHLITAP